MSQSLKDVACQTHVVVTDAELRIRFVSEGFCDALDCESAGLIGRSLANWLSDAQDGEQFARTVRRLNEHDTFSRVLSLTTANDEKQKFEFKLVPVLDPTGDRTIYMAVGGRQVAPLAGDSEAALRFAAAYGGSSLTFHRGQQYYHELERAMSDGEAFKDPELTIGRMARRLGTNTQYLSQVVNFFAGSRFSTYVNNRRLESLAVRVAAGERLDPNEAWASAGFGSYSAFYRALRRHYGIRPGAFFLADQARVATREHLSTAAGLIIGDS